MMVRSGVTMWIKMLERIAYHGLLNLLIPGFEPLLRLFILISLIVGLGFEYRKQQTIIDEKRVLQELSRLLNLIESGNSPRYSLEQVEIPAYPDYLIHPHDEHFNPIIFRRQVGLYEKKILLKAEIDAEFGIVRYRMMVMRFLPLGLMFGLQQFMKQTPGAIGRWIIIGFLISYYLAEGMNQ